MSKPGCCHEEALPLSCHSEDSGVPKRKGFDLLLWGSLSAVSLLFVLGAFFVDEIAAYHALEVMADTAYHMIHAMWWGIAIGVVFIGFLSKVPREFTMSILGEGGTMSGLLRATGAGVLLDLCSHGILMVGTKRNA